MLKDTPSSITDIPINMKDMLHLAGKPTWLVRARADLQPNQLSKPGILS